MSDITPRQEAVGKCPVCGKVPTWFNDVPLRAFCFGTEDNEHPEASRIVPGPAQPYGKVTRSVWKVAKQIYA